MLLLLVLFLAEARTSFFIDYSVGFGFLSSVAEAHWRTGSARLPLSFAAVKPGPLNPFLSDTRTGRRRSPLWVS